MQFTDGRGHNSRKTKKENAKRVRDFFEKNPKSTQKECAETLGLSDLTVRRRMREIADQEKVDG